MEIWHVQGGKRLEGACFVQGSKNASLPVLAACIVRPVRVELKNEPDPAMPQCFKITLA